MLEVHLVHAGVQLSKEDVMDLRVVGRECVGKALPDLVGWNRHVKPVTSGIHADLVSQASFTTFSCCMTGQTMCSPSKPVS